MWTKSQIGTLVTTKKFAVAAASVTSLASGLVVGHLLTKKTLEEKYRQMMDEEIEDAKEYYQRLNKVGEYSDPSKLAERYATEEEVAEHLKDDEDDPDGAEVLEEVVERLKYHTSLKDVKEKLDKPLNVEQSIRKNIFDEHEPTDPFDLENERNNRKNGVPYIISSEEFLQNEMEHNQVSLTYFEGDGVLMEDEGSAPIRDIVGALGPDNLKFGYGSGEEHIVYVRNEARGADFEVARSDGSYLHEVHGMEEENSLKHSQGPKIRKMRDRDY